MRIAGLGLGPRGPDAPVDQAWAAEFATRGFGGPVRVLSRREANRLWGVLRRAPAAEFGKGFGASSPAFYAIATRSAILDRVSAVLGDDVMLWGASIVVRGPGQVHPWHTDMETAGNEGRTVSVWIGLRNVNRNSSLRVLPGSHAWDSTIQDLVQQRGMDREGVTADVVAEWGRERDATATVVAADMGDGDAIFFDGRLWHGTNNTNETGKRAALLLQYATPDRAMRIPDYTHLELPFKFLDEPRPPCIMVRGTDRFGVNRIVEPPTEPDRGPSWVGTFDLPLAEDGETGWQMYPAGSGATPCVRKMSSHVSVLSPGREPHPPHRHVEEELLIVLDGEATLKVGEERSGDRRNVVARTGDVAYYPAWFTHTLENTSQRPVTYLMFKWKGDRASEEPAAGRAAHAADHLPGRVHAAPGSAADVPAAEGWNLGVAFAGRTEYLEKLHMHVSVLEPGAGYEPHVDAYDVALVILEGVVETRGRRLGPGAVVYCAAGEPHGLRSVGDTPARYYVFEFHGASRAFARSSSRTVRLARRVAAMLPPPASRLARRGWRLLRAAF